MYFKRDIVGAIKRALLGFSAVMITGPRQVGKTTMLNTEFDNFKYVSLDDLFLRELAKREPRLFLKKFSSPLIIDEIQYAPDLMIYLKMEIDANPNQKGKYILTDSQKFSLMRGVSESMAGRVAVLDMLGLSNSEISGRKGKIFDPEDIDFSRESNDADENPKDIFAKIWRGAFPALYDGFSVERDAFYRSYVSTYIERDIRDLAKISDESAFLRFLRTLAARTGQLLNAADIAKDVDIDVRTAKSWLSIIETTGLVYRLQPYFMNRTKRWIKTPKLYFLDTGLACYLTQWSSPEALEVGNMNGAMFETYVFCELLKSFWNQGKEAPFYFYRDRDMKEIDLLIEKDGALFPIEIKKTAAPRRNATKNFSVLEKTGMRVGHGAVVCLVDSSIPISETTTAIPVGEI